MGTNFYWHQPANVCESCGHDAGSEELHIGKSSAGWCFSLRIHPDLGINELDDWKERWAIPGSRITNEYGDAVSPEEMLKRICERSHPNGDHLTPGWLAENGASKGPNGLARHGYNARPGAGTYDLCDYEFC